jgi:hypothetical protein
VVATLEAPAMSGNVDEMLRKIGEVVPSYRPAKERFPWLRCA